MLSVFEKYFLLDGKAAKAHERNFHECPCERKFFSLHVCRSGFTL